MDATAFISANVGTLIGAAVVMTIAMFWIKFKIYPLLPAAFWVILANFELNIAAVKYWNNMDWDMGYLFYVFAVFCFICVIMLNKKEKPVVEEVKDDREDWEKRADEHEKNMRRIRYYRPKRRPKRPQDYFND
ncbi:MAG: hypothetical protein WC499_04825 [Patescibacteria group bacterium]